MYTRPCPAPCGYVLGLILYLYFVVSKFIQVLTYAPLWRSQFPSKIIRALGVSFSSDKLFKKEMFVRTNSEHIIIPHPSTQLTPTSEHPPPLLEKHPPWVSGSSLATKNDYEGWVVRKPHNTKTPPKKGFHGSFEHIKNRWCPTIYVSLFKCV